MKWGLFGENIKNTFWDITIDYVILSAPLSKSFVMGIHVQFVQHLQMCASVFQHDFSLAPVSQCQYVQQSNTVPPQRRKKNAQSSYDTPVTHWKHPAIEQHSWWDTFTLGETLQWCQIITTCSFYQCASSLKSHSLTCMMMHVCNKHFIARKLVYTWFYILR